MGPTLIFDKSAFQSFSRNELFWIRTYYYLNFPPVLKSEILGDLKKKTKLRSPEEEVQILASKMTMSDSFINAPYQKLVLFSFLGCIVNMGRRTIVDNFQKFKTRDGKGCIYIDLTPECRTIFRWQAGKFNKNEKFFAASWRENTRRIDIDTYKKKLLQYHVIIPKADNFIELKNVVNRLFRNPHLQIVFAELLIDHLNIPKNIKHQIQERWFMIKPEYLKKFAPYANYCARVYFTFLAGLSCGLINAQPKNRIDIQYFFYIPFCNVFCSDDHLHKNLADHFLEEDQTFIEGKVLKEDIRNIMKIKENQKKKNKQNKLSPPHNENSITYQLWKKNLLKKN